MQHRRCVIQVAVLCLAVLTAVADAQDCGGCLETGCLDCGSLLSKHAGESFLTDFRPAACFATVSLDLVALERNGGDSLNVLFSGATPLANVTDLNFVTELGFRLDLILAGDGDCDLNVNVFATGHDQARATRADPTLSFSFLGLSPAVPAASYTVEYEADLTSVEANLRSRQWKRVSQLSVFGSLT